MTWIMFDNKLMHAESGIGFYKSFNSIHYFKGFGEDVMTTECFFNSEQVEARFLELQKMLIQQPERPQYKELELKLSKCKEQ